jgi:hypothetical protein
MGGWWVMRGCFSRKLELWCRWSITGDSVSLTSGERPGSEYSSELRELGRDSRRALYCSAMRSTLDVLPRERRGGKGKSICPTAERGTFARPLIFGVDGLADSELDDE